MSDEWIFSSELGDLERERDALAAELAAVTASRERLRKVAVASRKLLVATLEKKSMWPLTAELNAIAWELEDDDLTAPEGEGKK